MRMRAKEAGVTIEQIIDGATGCHIWFFIDVGKRECFISEQEQDDGSVVYFLSTVDDLLLIPDDFYLLSNRQQTGANSCIFNSFIFNDRSYEILAGISAEEVLEQGLFEKITETAFDSSKSCTNNPADIKIPDYSVLAQRRELIDAFGVWGLKEAWFNDLGKIPWLKSAKRVDGKSARGGFPAFFCPYTVMQGMVLHSRKCSLSEQQGWKTLERKFPKVFERFEINKPDFDQSK